MRDGRESKILWLDLGDLRPWLMNYGPLEQWQDHGLGLLRTILKGHGIQTDLASTRAFRTWRYLGRRMMGYDTLLMNVRSHTFPFARQAGELFKRINPEGIVVTGGIHASVALDEMEHVAAFDRICQGPGENIIVDLVRDPLSADRVTRASGSKSMADWPMIDRMLWPKIPLFNPFKKNYWPLEPSCGWGPGPVATVLSSRVCPWRCAFCNENAFIPIMGRKPVDMIIDELNNLDAKYGPLGSVVFHDSMFFQNPKWLKEWLDKYPRRANRIWPYWAAARPDTVRRWPQLFQALIRETNWNTISVGFESGSDRVLQILNKECTVEDNYFVVDLLNRIGEKMLREGKETPKAWANVMFGIPGERREDAFETMKMIKSMRWVIPSISFYAPYPGSALGYQLIAEGKSLMTKENYHRHPSDEKVKGIDYGFYSDLLKGRYDAHLDNVVHFS